MQLALHIRGTPRLFPFALAESADAEPGHTGGRLHAYRKKCTVYMDRTVPGSAVARVNSKLCKCTTQSFTRKNSTPQLAYDKSYSWDSQLIPSDIGWVCK